MNPRPSGENDGTTADISSPTNTRSTTDAHEAVGLYTELSAAANGAEALDTLGGERFDAILSDTRMPILDGIGLDQELERRHAELEHRVAFLTGDRLSAEKRALLARTGAPSPSTPFGLDEVQRVVQRLLAP